MAITIKDTSFTSDISLVAILNVMTKVKMLKICDKLDLYVSPNLNYEDLPNNQWHMLMPNEVREALKDRYPLYLDLADAGKKLPSKKQLRLMSALGMLMGEE